MDETLVLEKTFTLIITDVCTDESITSPTIEDMAYHMIHPTT
jgi:hypothetical protein